jgi:hypothetical protein
MVKAAYISVSCCLLIACSDKNESVLFPETVRLSVSSVYTTDIYMRYPYRIRAVDSSIYIMDLHAVEHYIHKLSDEKNMKTIASYGKRGEGPEEFLDAENIRLDSEDRLWTLDANRHKLTRWDSCGQKEINLSPQLIRSLDFALINDSTFIVPDYTGENRICIIDENGQIIKKLFSIPDKSKHNVSPASLAQAWRSFIDYNRETGILAIVTQLGQVIELYDMKEERCIASINTENEAPVFIEKQGYAIPDGIMGYSDVYVSESAVYALFWGSSFEDIRRGKVKNEGGNRIRVFNTEGTPLKEYILDRYITGLRIDEANSMFLALDVNDDQPIIEYKFETRYEN